MWLLIYIIFYVNFSTKKSHKYLFTLGLAETLLPEVFSSFKFRFLFLIVVVLHSQKPILF